MTKKEKEIRTRIEYGMKTLYIDDLEYPFEDLSYLLNLLEEERKKINKLKQGK